MEEQIQVYNVPDKYRQPSTEYKGRILKNETELVTYSAASHIRIWYNNQTDGYPLHIHDALEVCICVRDTYEIHVNDKVYVLQADDILIIPPRTPHEYINDHSGVRFIYLMEMNSYFESSDYKILEPYFFNALLFNRSLFPDIYDEVYNHFMHMNDVYFSSSPFWETAVYTDMYSVFSAIGQFLSTRIQSQWEQKAGKSNFTRINALLHYIDLNYHESMTAEAAALFCGFSKFHFLRLFKQHTGYTYHDYLNVKRIQVAEDMMSRDEDISITDIAYHTGFNNLVTFSRTFRKYTNCSPNEYKMLLKRDEEPQDK